MPCCCSPFECAVNRQFNQQKVAQELDRHRRKGPGPTARLLEDGIARAGPLAGTVLDIGSGVGALTFALLERGATRAVAVDASAAYVSAAREEAERLGRADAIQFVHADFVTAAASLSAASVVVLDRVVCCYPSYEQLLPPALAHAQRCLALSYPRDAWYVRLVTAVENGQRRLARNSFRTFVHPSAAMEALIRNAGFQLLSRRETWVWAADVYIRV